MWGIIIGLCWLFLHQVFNMANAVIGIKESLQCYFSSSGILKKYKDLQMKRLRYLAIVLDGEEALLTSRVIELLQWLSALDMEYVCLYDIEGVLKKNKETFLKSVGNSRLRKGFDGKVDLHRDGKMTLEFISDSDGKEGIAKAASYLCSKYLKTRSAVGSLKEPIFAETDMDTALGVVGCGGPEPNLLLIYGPARCHLGFPAWRMRYTEIIHMGRLKSMKHGALVKAIHKFLLVHQNYGK